MASPMHRLRGLPWPSRHPQVLQPDQLQTTRLPALRHSPQPHRQQQRQRILQQSLPSNLSPQLRLRPLRPLRHRPPALRRPHLLRRRRQLCRPLLWLQPMQLRLRPRPPHPLRQLRRQPSRPLPPHPQRLRRQQPRSRPLPPRRRLWHRPALLLRPRPRRRRPP